MKVYRTTRATDNGLDVTSTYPQDIAGVSYRPAVAPEEVSQSTNSVSAPGVIHSVVIWSGKNLRERIALRSVLPSERRRKIRELNALVRGGDANLTDSAD
jgi:hypothetical protein